MAVFCFAFLSASVVSEAKSPVVIGQATNGEGGKLRGCTAGDQSGSEVSLGSWGYGSGAYKWKYVFRAKDPSVAKKMAENMKAAAANNHVGYDQNSPDRNTFYDEAKKVGWDISAITTNCETTCGSAISVCINAAGIEVPRTWYSEIIPRDIMKTGAFDAYTTSDFVASDAKLLPGDILCNPDAHSAMVVESPNKFTFIVSYKDDKGNDAETEITEGDSVYLNLNNGKNSESVVVENEVDLKDYEPEKKSYDFSGWTQTDENTFSANYESSTGAIKTSNKKLKSLD